MKLFKTIQTWFENQEHLFYLFLAILMAPNLALCVTEPMTPLAKVCNILLPLGCYYVLMTLSRNCGKMLWFLFLFVFLGAFQIVLLYLFGQSIIAVDMFLNLVTTNSSEALELLDNLLPAIGIVLLLYVPALVMAAISVVRKRKLSTSFMHKQRRRAGATLAIGFLSLLGAELQGADYEITTELYPLNVCYNAKLAVERTALTEHYHASSRDFSYHARATHPQRRREVYVMVIGETSRADNWQLFGYNRATNPRLSEQSGLVTFPKTLSESNTTHKSVPMLLSGVNACDFDSIYYRKGIITAFKEAGFHTAFFSNQRRNHSFIDFFGMEADTYDFIKEDSADTHYNPSDEELLNLVTKELDRGAEKEFIVLHAYGSHFNYHERYPGDKACFTPDYPTEAEPKNRPQLVNAYDNTIRQTDDLLARLILLLETQEADAAVAYTSDHGEDIFDDARLLFLHASPVPSYYQLHVPLLLWMSPGYRTNYPEHWQAAMANRDKDISSSHSFFHTVLDLAGIATPYANNSLSVVSTRYAMRPRVYLTDHNKPAPLTRVGMKKEDFEMLRKKGIGEWGE
ncbi:MAG: lipid A phosphoethanolamine transferase [Mediterranea sp.]|nr:lipid A phosphoethanolamine transferase [Mediterranea sp.]